VRPKFRGDAAVSATAVAPCYEKEKRAVLTSETSMTEPGSVSYVPIATGDGGSSSSKKKKGHARRFSDSALGGDASSWAPPSSPGRQSLDGAAAFEPSHLQSPPQLRHYETEPPSFDSPQNKSSSLQDQVLQGTLELLKMAGGATLSTTGKLIQPPLHVTQHLLLPALWGALKDFLNQYTPLRVKDWFRILESSVHHLVTVIGNTAKGRIFQSKLHSVGDGIVDCLSSDASRQAIMDGMAAWVKLAEALQLSMTVHCYLYESHNDCISHMFLSLLQYT
jgi:hypothetical protein